MASSMQAALSGITRMMIEGNSEIKNVFSRRHCEFTLGKHVLLKEQAIKCAFTRTPYQHGPEDAVRRWKDQVSTLKMCPTFRELQRVRWRSD